jgi:alanyl-tRNA synthetase
MDCAEICQKFVEYYQNLGFQLLPRAPMMHPSIPLSFVMSAGLVQVETSLANSKDRSGDKFVLVQDCFRHFDLNSIGSDNIHLSLFEMPGAFVFGNNGQQQIIAWMWELVTEILGIDPQRIWISYFGGDTVHNQALPKDELTYQTWRKIGIPEDRLIGLGVKHNYWIQGNGSQNGNSHLRKCGPNTELFYDLGQDQSCAPDCRPGCRCGRFIEFANSLFILYNFRPETNALTPMEDPYNETVIGTERVAMLLQDAPSVFDTQDYCRIIETIHQFVTNANVPNDVMRESEHVIADHLRALYVLVSDGAPPPGKNGRERIVKLLIRGVLTRQILLGITAPEFLATGLVSVLEAISKGNGYHASAPYTLKTLNAYFASESQRFYQTVKSGFQIMEKMLTNNQGQTLSGEQIVTLEKQQGLPLPLIVNRLHDRQLPCAKEAYKIALAKWNK